MAVRALVAAGLLALAPVAAWAQAPAPSDTAVVVEELEFGPARRGENPLRARVRNVADTAVLVVMDLRAVPGMWMRPNMQDQYAVELDPGQETVLEGTYEFVRLSPEATLRVGVGRGEYLEEYGVHVLRKADFWKTFAVGRDSPEAYDPAQEFTLARRGPLEIWAWKGSLAEARMERIARERLRGLEAAQELLEVEAPERIRVVFYADEETKVEHTGHRGVGWAYDSTLVEVFNDSMRMDPYHELVHVAAAAAGSPPPLLSEGLAVYVSERLGTDALGFLGVPGEKVDRMVCRLRGTPDLISLEELLGAENIPSDEGRGLREYAEAGSFVKHLVERRGLARFRNAYGALRSGGEPQANAARLREIYGTALLDLETEWLQAIGEACRGG